MANASIFQQYLQAPQSVTSKIAALDQADFQRAQMEGAVRQNRLQELAFQRDEESRANAARRGGAIQSILSQAGGDEAAAVKGLRQAGFYDEAGKMESDLLGRTEKRATIAGKETENATKSFQQRRTEIDTAIRDITMFETPEQALADLQSKVQAGKLPPEQAQGMAQLIQTNPNWQTKLLRGLMQAKDQLDLDERQAARAQQGQQSAAQLAQAAELARLQDATARRGQDVSAATARRGQDLSAQDAAARRAAEAAKAAQTPTSQQSKVQDAQEALRLIEDASAALKKSTGSYVGTAIDTLAQAFGYATPGAQASAQLKAIEGMLVSKMPKMSGPQSDADVKLYRQMAGTIGDPTVPNETKVAALQTIKAIQERYAGIGQQPQGNPLGNASMPGQPRVVDFGSLK